MSVQIELLKNIPYFTGLSVVELESVKKIVMGKTAERGSILFMDGEPARALYFLVSGLVKIFKTSIDGKEQIYDIIKPGESFNEVPVFDNELSPVSAQVMASAVLYEIDKNSFHSLILKYPKIADNVIQILARRVRDLVDLVEDLSFRTVIGRVAKILYDNASDGKTSGPRLTQQEMAAMAGTAREVVGRSLKALEEEGILTVDRNRIIIKNKEALKKRSSSV